MIFRCFLLLIIFSAEQRLVAQYVPLISGGVGFLTNTNGGLTSYSAPLIEPLVAAPIGQHLLFESREFVLESATPRESPQSYQTHIFSGVTYLQMDYLVTHNLTFVAGKYLVPFGTYNERLSPIWISNFQDSPLIVPIGIMNGAGTGGMVRGSLVSTPKFSVDYAAYLSANLTTSQFESQHSTGGRVDVFFPASRLEIGTSYGRLFQGVNSNASGFHVWWQPRSIPLSIRSEYAHGQHSQGYWIEAAYRLSQWSGTDSWLGRFEPVFRLQQTFRNSPGSDGLPSADTQRADFALDYHLPHEVRINTSYERQFSSTGDRNIWETGIVYRFLFPAWKGK